ncbi:40S ribosomal protein S5 [Blastocystis sp. subtype 4]|uniref:40S ribosomal protein S5 n=1 Tax=Blastocystis sp. subtype 4 TaxID=944170 RepID=UPI000711D855|nr:40S ribosomal protein S5 [Blastocystis sp. subtype 4]KNB44859.1 40S ribosomal protein S5 [Blastocystis sp. subtype 4]|eukprot:XP_014528302.1 40S ribosomal protein S5 [Blastocystis sp. subtype 4]
MAAAAEIKLFGKWTFDDVEVSEVALKDHLAVAPKNATYLPHTAGRYQLKRFRKGQCPLVERLANCLMFHGRNTGKKMNAMKIVEQAFDIINLMTEKNPLQVLVEAVSNAGPREDSTRIGTSGVVRRQAVDVSPFRRVSFALTLLTTGVWFMRLVRLLSVTSRRWLSADELINASKGSSNSYAIKKKDEIERVAKANR